MKYIHFSMIFAHIFYILSSNSQIMPRKSPGTIINFAGFTTHNTRRTTVLMFYFIMFFFLCFILLLSLTTRASPPSVSGFISFHSYYHKSIHLTRSIVLSRVLFIWLLIFTPFIYILLLCTKIAYSYPDTSVFVLPLRCKSLLLYISFIHFHLLVVVLLPSLLFRYC